MTPGIWALVFAGLYLAGAASGWVLGVQGKRPPRPRKHSHEWGKWGKVHEVRVSRGGTPESELMGWRYYYERVCETCGEEQHELKEVGNI